MRIMKERKNMKKRRKTFTLLIFMIFTALIISACSSSTDNGSSTEKTDDSSSEMVELVVYNRLNGFCELAAESIDKVMLEEHNTVIVCQDLSASQAYTKVQAEKNDPLSSVIVADSGVIAAGSEQ